MNHFSHAAAQPASDDSRAAPANPPAAAAQVLLFPGRRSRLRLRALQSTAHAVYNITKKEDLGRFTSHSIRVGACVLLHTQNISAEDIKFRLRWRSDAFRMYLRNVTQLAERHKNAINMA